MKARLLLPALFAALVCGAASGQVPMSRWSSFKPLPHGYVDRSSLNVHLVFPIFNRDTGSRAQVKGVLLYDSDLWTNNGSAWQPLSGGGWHFAANVGGSITQWQSAQIPCGSWGATYQQSSYTYSFPDGTTGPAGSYLVVFGGGLHGGEGCPTPQDGSTTQAVQTQYQSYTVWTSAAGGVGIWDTQGDNELFDFQDRHYNSVTSSTSSGVTTYADPLGTALTVDNNTNPISYSSTGSAGSMISVLETMETIPASANFGCYGSWSGNISVPLSLQYPNGDTYTFGYDAEGRLASMVLPTGGTIYFPTTESCSSGVVSKTLERWESVDGSGSAWHWSGNGTVTTETTPAGDNNVYTFGTGDVLAEADQYQGSSTEISATTVASSSPNGYIGSQTITTELMGSQPRYAVRQLGFDEYGNVTSSSATDWGTTTAGGPALRSTAATWNVLGASGGFADQESLASVYNPQGGVESQTSWAYNTTGEVSEISRWSGIRWLNTTFTYNGNGTLASLTEPNNATTSYTYGACNSFFPTLIQSPVTAVKTTLSWNCSGPVVTSATDANGLSTYYSYTDAYQTWRLTSVQAPNGGVTQLSRTANSSESHMDFNGSVSTAEALVTLDALGRPVLNQRRQGQQSSSFDSVETRYDAMDRGYQVSQPYTATAGVLAGAYWTTTSFDPLSRPLSVADAGGGSTQYAYTQNDVLISREPGDLKRTQEELDALGRLQSVCEITAQAGGGSCGQTAAATGFLTSYVRNGHGQITQVTQGGQTRSYSFDGVGRLTAETNPESGATQYYYGAYYRCSDTSYGDVLGRVDANGNITCYSYDTWHRTTEISYIGPNAGAARYFVYDAATVDGQAMHDVAGRLAEAYTGSPSAKTTDLGFSYFPGSSSDNEGVVYESTPHSGGWLIANEEHYPNGAAMDRFVTDGPAVSYSVDGEGRPYAASGGPTLVSSTGYTAAGQPATVAMASGVSDNYYYDSGSGRMTEYKFTVGAGADDGLLGWNSNGSLASLTISDSVAGTGDGQTCNYSRDDLARLTGVNCGSAWNQTFTLDRWGNLAKSGNQSFSALYASNNRISSNLGVVPHYDTDGNLLDDPTTGAAVNAFDAEGHMTSLEDVNLTYDALGRAVEAETTSGATAEFVYGPDGRKLAVMNGQALVRADFPLPGGGEAAFTSGGTLMYLTHGDDLGSARLATSPSGGLYSVTAYAPYGETYAPTNPAVSSFTGHKQDIAAGNYDYRMRELSAVQGRWWTPDSAGLAAVDPNNPQSWNRYAYVGGTPLEAIDPLGLESVFCQPHAQIRNGPLRHLTSDANGEFGPYDADSGDGGGLGGGDCPVTLDGVTLDFGLGDQLSGGAFSGGGSPGSMITVQVPGSRNPPLQVVPQPGGGGWCYQGSRGQLLCDPRAWYEAHLPDPSTLTTGVLGSTLARSVASLNPEYLDRPTLNVSFIQSPAIEPPAGSSASRAWEWTKRFAVDQICGSSPANAIWLWARDGAAKGVITGAWGGGAVIGAPSAGVGAIPGAIAGGVALGIIGASAGVVWGAAAAAGCSAAGVYGN